MRLRQPPFKAAKQGQYLLGGLAIAGRPVGGRPVANHMPFRTTLQRNSLVKLDVGAEGC